MLLLSLDCSTLPLICTLYCWVSKSLAWRDLGLNPGLRDHWRTLYPLDQWAGYKAKLAHKSRDETADGRNWNNRVRTILLFKKLDGNYTRMLRAILNKSWRQQPSKHQLYGHLPPITKTIQVRRARHAGHCWGSRDELIRDVLLWTPTYGRANAGRPVRTYIQQLCEDTGCSSEDLPEAMNDRVKWRERVRDIRASSTTWWWWWWRHRTWP